MLAFLIALFVRSLAVAALAGLVVWRVKSPARRHAVWTFVTCGMLFLGLAMVTLPAIPVRVLAPAAPIAHPALVTSPPAPAVPSTLPTPSPLPGQPFPWEPVLIAIYATGLVIFGGRLAYGYYLTRALVNRSLRLTRFEPDSVYEAACVSVPLTVGWLRPRILLPSDWEAWAPEKLDAVLVHERTHVKRADWAVAVIAGVNRCVFWFHPLAWWLEKRLNVLAEQACDDASLPHVASRECYAQVLVEMAAAVRPGAGRVGWEAMAMAKGAEVRMRIERILDDSRQLGPAMTLGRWLVLALCGIPVVYFAAVAIPRHVRAEVPPPTPAIVSETEQEPQSPSRPADLQAKGTIATLIQLDSEFANFKAENMGRLPEQFQANLAQLSALQSNLAGASEGLSRLQREKLMLETQLQNLTTQMAYYRANGAVDEEMAKLQGRLEYLRLEAAKARETYTSDHPELKRLLDLMAATERDRAALVPAAKLKNEKMLLDLEASANMAKTQMGNLNLEMEERIKQVREMQRQIAAQQARIESAPEVEMRYAKLMRDYQMAQEQQAFQQQRPADESRGVALLLRREPEYTPDARKAGVEGKVELSVTIGPDGRPGDIRVTRGLGHGLDEKAAACVKQWRFSPATRNGHPVTAFASVEVTFRLP